MKKQKENSHEGITWSEMGKQNVQAEKVYWIYWEAKMRTNQTGIGPSTPGTPHLTLSQ